MNWYTINENFLDFLRGYENRIPKMNYGPNSLKPFFGVLFEIGDLVYVTQVSHPQKRHVALKESLDFSKLYKDTDLIGVVNLNYMFPVHKEHLIHVDYKNISNFRGFRDEKEKNDYIVLLKREMKEIKKKKINQKAYDLYSHKYTFPNNIVSKRCVEFKELEKKCFEFKALEKNKTF